MGVAAVEQDIDAEGVPVWLELGVAVVLELGVAVVLELGVSVVLELGVPVWLLLGVPVWLELGVPVWLLLGVPLGVLVAVPVDVGVNDGTKAQSMTRSFIVIVGCTAEGLLAQMAAPIAFRRTCWDPV